MKKYIVIKTSDLEMPLGKKKGDVNWEKMGTSSDEIRKMNMDKSIAFKHQYNVDENGNFVTISPINNEENANKFVEFIKENFTENQVQTLILTSEEIKEKAKNYLEEETNLNQKLQALHNKRLETEGLSKYKSVIETLKKENNDLKQTLKNIETQAIKTNELLAKLVK